MQNEGETKIPPSKKCLTVFRNKCGDTALIHLCFLIHTIAVVASVENKNTSKIIRYFEIGAQTELGVDMIERGVPIITVRKIEKKHIVGETLSLQKGYVKENISRFLFDLDDYEKHLLKKYLDDHA